MSTTNVRGGRARPKRRKNRISYLPPSSPSSFVLTNDHLHRSPTVPLEGIIKLPDIFVLTADLYSPERSYLLCTVTDRNIRPVSYTYRDIDQVQSDAPTAIVSIYPYKIICAFDNFINLRFNPRYVLIPLSSSHVLSATPKNNLQDAFARVARMYVQNRRYVSMSLRDLEKEWRKQNIDLQVFDADTMPLDVPCCICGGLEDYEIVMMDATRNSDHLVYYRAYRGKVTMALMVIDARDAPEEIVVELFCANKMIPSPAARLLFTLILKRLKGSVKTITLYATSEGQPFYATFGFKGKSGYMKLDMENIADA